MTMIEKVRAAERAPSSIETRLAVLNAVTVTVEQLATARQILGQLADELSWDVHARRGALSAELDETDTMIEAIDARLLAVRKWEDIHDRDRVLYQLHLMEAATLVPLVETEHGIGFSDTTFREVVEFVAELPW